MSRYQTFVFRDYDLDSSTKILSLTYGYDDSLLFTETYKFDFEWPDNINPEVLDRACQLVFFLAGISYYKAFLTPTIKIKKGEMFPALANFLGKTYQKGLGEFFYVNTLDPQTLVSFPINSEVPKPVAHIGKGMLIGIGGGKDSLVSVELLRKSEAKISTWSLGHRSQLSPLVERIGTEHKWVERALDSKLLELNKQGAYNGHIPISAIFAAVGTLVAVLSGQRDVVVSNEQSANEPTLNYQGIDINHQYSKSLEYEKDYQAILENYYGQSLRYYSLLRPFSELYIAEMFSNMGFEKYKDVFSSCNKAYTSSSDRMFWCGKCSKCAFTFLALAAFVDRVKLEQLFSGKNLLLNPDLVPTYKQLLGISGNKPLECVGEIRESRAAMHLAQKQYPELEKYEFELDEDYIYEKFSEHAMPVELADSLR